ncbi:DUF1564 domain-containing protein [Leptospira gomenensis]|uniref:DUF1564 domain-containing protein n=1 Tax=Leptospira gomenensis TaxID=2484974 RepID=A0A5F1YFQ1_9LEPT|nr:DUF1564 domain-containing protein [Leptospira gomenensis]TGK38507.1 DUF1564 domain-containing protein [Leptospira gomenensis]TGK42013.1 DUF1564 domain-containing protein [Leptospira gomenensis]TGK52265.1 DUF1564 domain-containing protein [Leptospira gomenensis]TGK55798.1 DUF1564 domain-containing protein [Leptospira gomenensis]
MEILSFASDRRIESVLFEGPLETDSLLVPESYWYGLGLKERKFLPKRLPFLLRKYGKYLSSMERLHFQADRIKYNRAVGKMKKFSIHVNKGAWTVLGVLAATHGVSRCYLFNYMLWLEDVGVGDSIVNVLNRGVPSLHGIYRMIWTLDLRQNTVSRDLEFEPNPMIARNPYNLPRKSPPQG